MKVEFGADSKGAVYLAWEQVGLGQVPNIGTKRAWIRRATGTEDWANTGRYLHIAATRGLHGGPVGMGAEYPIYDRTDFPDEQILIEAVSSINRICGIR